VQPTKTFDISDELKAIENRGRDLKTRQKAAIGETVIATGAEKRFTPDQLAGLLLDAIDRAKADSSVKKKWEELGAGFFRQKSKSGNGAASGNTGGGALDGKRAANPARVAATPASNPPDLLSRAQSE